MIKTQKCDIYYFQCCLFYCQPDNSYYWQMSSLRMSVLCRGGDVYINTTLSLMLL